ncbi:unnamed protein product, partial [Vitis vinifera]
MHANFSLNPIKESDEDMGFSLFD